MIEDGTWSFSVFPELSNAIVTSSAAIITISSIVIAIVNVICGAIITSSSSALFKVVEYLNINDVLFSSTELQWP